MWQGLSLGLGLAALFGPIFIALSKAALQKGGRAGFRVGFGIWFSDVVIVLAIYYLISQLVPFLENSIFYFWLGQLGGIVLIGMGLLTLIRKTDFSMHSNSGSILEYTGDFFKGVAVNTLNPFTFIFWTGVISTYVIGKKITDQQAIVLLGTTICTIVITDSLKILTVKMIKNHLTSVWMAWIIKGAGCALIVFGIFLMIRTNSSF